MSAESAKGSCLCGAVRFELAFPTKWAAHCHCSMCRRAHGAAFVSWVGVPSTQFRFLSGEDQLTRFASSEAATRSFCRHCGSTLFFQSTRWPDEVHVAMGNLEEPLDRAPKAHVFFSDRVAWLEVNDGLPRYGGKTGMEPL